MASYIRPRVAGHFHRPRIVLPFDGVTIFAVKDPTITYAQVRERSVTLGVRRPKGGSY